MLGVDAVGHILLIELNLGSLFCVNSAFNVNILGTSIMQAVSELFCASLCGLN